MQVSDVPTKISDTLYMVIISKSKNYNNVIRFQSASKPDNLPILGGRREQDKPSMNIKFQ